MKVGILGTGFGAYHAELYAGMEEVEELHIYGRNAEKLKELERKLTAKLAGLPVHPGIITTCNVDDIYNNDGIDLIDVCLPDSLHREFAVRALEKGKHVYCETPVAPDMEAAEAIGAACARYGRLAFADLFVRFQGPYLYLKDICAKGTYGRLRTLGISRKTPPLWGDLGPQSIVTALMIHDIDLVYWLLGSPGRITSECTRGKAGQCSVTSLLEFDGTCVELTGSSMMPCAYPFAVSYEAVFDEAAVRFSEDGYRASEVSSMTLFTQSDREDIMPDRRNCYEEAIRHVLGCIRDGGQPVNGIGDATASLGLALKIKEQILE